MTALETGGFPMLTRADGYPEPLRPSGPLTLLPDAQSAPEAHAPAVRSDAPRVRRWPLLFIASPAAVAIWSGWVALGAMCGFGPVNLLPGIGSGFTLNTAITLPVGVEAYGAFALGAWLLPGTPERARRFAQKSAIGSLVLGMTGQVIYHLLAAAHATKAPWPVTVVVACMPVATLGFGAALMHLMRAGESTATASERRRPEAPPEAVAEPPAPLPEAVAEPIAEAPAEAPPATVPEAPARPQQRTARTASGSIPKARKDTPETAPEKRYAADLAAGTIPSLRQIQADMKVGYARAKEVRAALEVRAAGSVVALDDRRQA